MVGEGLAVGAFAGLAIAVYRLLLSSAERLLRGLIDWFGTHPVGWFGWAVALVLLASAVARLMQLVPDTRGSGIPQVDAEVMGRIDEPWYKVMVAKMAEGAIVMMDDSLDMPADLDPARVISIPILQTAKEKVGKAFTANIVAVGAINKALQLFSDEVLMEGVKRHIPAGTEEINQKALAEGAALITEEQAAAFKQQIG